jgi:hypothetical protein
MSLGFFNKKLNLKSIEKMNFREDLISTFQEEKENYLNEKSNCIEFSKIVNQQLRDQFCNEKSQLEVKVPEPKDDRGFFKFDSSLKLTENVVINFSYSIKEDGNKFFVKFRFKFDHKIVEVGKSSPYGNLSDRAYQNRELQDGIEYLHGKFKGYIKGNTDLIIG